jgi:uncharacterized protein (DUF2062 family)
VLAAWVGTLIGNPWTFPVIWIVIYKLGTMVIGIPETGEAERLSFDLLISHPTSAIRPLLLPMAVGGLPVALLSWFVSYWLVRRSIDRFQALRRQKLEAVRARRTVQKRNKDGEGQNRIRNDMTRA